MKASVRMEKKNLFKDCTEKYRHAMAVTVKICADLTATIADGESYKLTNLIIYL